MLSMVSWGFHHLNSGDVRPNLHYFLLGDDVFALMPLLVKPYRRELKMEENSKERRRVGEMHLVSCIQIQGLTRHNGAMAKFCQKHCVDRCCATCRGHKQGHQTGQSP